MTCVSLNRDSEEQELECLQHRPGEEMYPTSGLKDAVTVEIDALVFQRWMTAAINVIQQAVLDQMLCSPSSRNISDVARGEGRNY